MNAKILVVTVIFMLAVGYLFWRENEDKQAVEKSSDINNDSQQDSEESNDLLSSNENILSATKKASSISKNTSSAEHSNATGYSGQQLNESMLIVEGSAIDSARASELAASNAAYDELLGALSLESTLTSANRQLVYQNLFTSSPLYLSGEVQVGDIVCGKQLCATSITATDPESASAFIGNVPKSADAPIYAIVEVNVSMEDKTMKRLVFSADPAISSIMMSR